MTSKLSRLKSYPFEKLNQLIGQVEPRKNLRNIDFSIGEPKHSPPSFILDQVSSAIQEMSRYPKIGGSDRLRDSIKKWLIKRYKLQIDSLDSDQNIAPVAGTREGLFSLTQQLLEIRIQRIQLYLLRILLIKSTRALPKWQMRKFFIFRQTSKVKIYPT